MPDSTSPVANPARCPAPSIQEIVRRDGQKIPDALALESDRSFGDEGVLYERYTSAAFFSDEMELMWPRVWQWVCREEHIPEPGDYYVYDVGRHSVIVVRTGSGDIKAYVNACLHRGTKLKPSASQGWTGKLACPFHGWTWSLEGKMVELPCSWDFPHVDKKEFGLPEAKVGTWGGFVFINLDENAPPLEEYLAPLPEHFARWDLSKRYVALHIEKELPCNWKAAQEAFMESYHTMVTHPQLLFALADVNTQYDVFGANISRYYSASGVASPNLESPPGEEELLATMFVGDRSVVGETHRFEAGDTARSVMARQLRATLGKLYQTDLSAYTDTEIIDTIGYGVFPNTTFFAGLSIPMVYRFRPLGRATDRALFDLFFLRPLPDSGERPEPAAPYRVGLDESWASVPGMDPDLAKVFDQDTSNMRLQQEGFESSRKPAATLSRYQELRIRHFQHRLTDYCGTRMPERKA